jgi:hypothetical protein
MNTWTQIVSAIAACAVVVTGISCVSPAKREKGKNEFVERVTLEEVAMKESPTEEMPALLIPIAAEIAKPVLKWLAAQGIGLLKNYADAYGATYSARAIKADYVVGGAGGSHEYYFLFRRTLVFKDVAKANEILHTNELQFGTIRFNERTNLEVDIVSVPICLQSSSDGRSIRFAPFIVPEGTNITWRDGSTNWRYATNIVFQHPKGDVLEAPWQEDKLTVAIGATFKFAQNVNGIVAAHTNTLAETLLSPKAGKATSAKWLATDWQPAPAGKAYSLEVTVVESSKLKEWVKKTAASLGKSADSAIDKEIDSAVKPAKSSSTNNPSSTK